METDVPCVVSTNLADWSGPGFRQLLTCYTDTLDDTYDLLTVEIIDSRHFYLFFGGGNPNDGVLDITGTGYHVVSTLGVLGAYGELFPIGLGVGIY